MVILLLAFIFYVHGVNWVSCLACVPRTQPPFAGSFSMRNNKMGTSLQGEALLQPPSAALTDAAAVTIASSNPAQLAAQPADTHSVACPSALHHVQHG